MPVDVQRIPLGTLDPVPAVGGGGRIALYYGTTDFAGTVTAQGGAGQQRGGAGTIAVITFKFPVQP